MGKKKTKTESSQTNSSVVTPTNPQWVQDTAASLNSGIQSIGAMDPYSLVAPASDLEKSAAQGASQLGRGFGGGAQSVGGDSWFADLLSQPAPSVNAASLLDNIEDYYNPYRTQVTDVAMADFDVDAGRTRAAQDLALAGNSAFGGSGAALTQSMTEGELSRARGAQLSKLLSDMFTTSAGLAGQDADRRQQASTANAQLALQNMQARGQLALDRDSGQRANLATQAAIGQQMRGIDQASRNAPLSLLGSQVDLFSGLPLQLFQGQTSNTTGTGRSTTTENPSFLDSLGRVVQVGSSLAGLGA